MSCPTTRTRSSLLNLISTSRPRCRDRSAFFRCTARIQIQNYAMEERSHRNKRIIAVAASTIISLACGTNYAYSAWAPQFAEKPPALCHPKQLDCTPNPPIVESPRLILSRVLPEMWACNASGIPLGYMVDKRGPHINTVLGAIALAGGLLSSTRRYSKDAVIFLDSILSKPQHTRLALAP